MVIAIIVAIFYFAISRLILEIGDLIENVPDLYSQLENGLRQIGGTLSGLFSRLPESVPGWLECSDSESGSDDGGFSEKSKRTNNGSSRKFR